MNGLLTQIQSLKTSLFDIAAMIYGLGLFNWSINSYNNSLGIVSAFETQYFIAGIIPFLILLLIYYSLSSKFLIVINLYRRLKFSIKRLKRSKPKIFKWVLVFPIALLIFIFFFYIGFKAFIEHDYALGFVSFIYVLYPIYIFRSNFGNYQKGKVSFKTKKIFYTWLNPTKFLIVYAKFVITVISVIFIFLYSIFIYPTIPQELGGAKPKEGIFECKKEAYNLNSIQQLFEDSTSSIIRSKKVLIYYNSPDKIILKENKYSETFELNRKDVTLILWMNNE